MSDMFVVIKFGGKIFVIYMVRFNFLNGNEFL